MDSKKILMIGGGVIIVYLLYKGYSDKKAKDLIASDLSTKTANCEAQFLENEKTVKKTAGFDIVAYKAEYMKNCLNATPETIGSGTPIGTEKQSSGIKLLQEDLKKGKAIITEVNFSGGM